jgi:predicted RNA binding protein YcfA (HicA-like mRNA interferase family)
MPDPQRLVPVDYRTLIRIFEQEGFRVSRQKGDHISMTKPGVPRPLIIKTSPRNVPIAHIRTNMTTAGMSRERFFDLLNRFR